MNEQSKRAKIRDAQAKHQSHLFGDDAEKASAQAATSAAKARGKHLTQAAQSKQRRMSPAEARKLEELKVKNARARAQQAPPVTPAPTVPEPRRVKEPDQPAPPPPQASPKTQELHQVAERSDMAAEAIANMKRHMKEKGSPVPKPARPTTDRSVPPPADQPAPPLSSQPPRQPAGDQTSLPPGQTPPPRQPTRRRPPSPEELDRLLRQMAQRARQRPGGVPRPAPGAYPPPRRPMPGRPEAGMEDAGPVEASPPPPDVVEREKHTAEQSAEILKGLRAREASAQQDITPIPQSDQTRAKEEAVEARVPIKTEANAIDSGPLHQAIAQLQIAMQAQDPGGQVHGVTQVQRTMPHHPLYDPKVANGQPQIDRPNQGGRP